MRKIAKFESDLLRTYEDIAPQNCENLQTLVCKFVPLSIQTSVKFLDLDCENLQTFVWWGRASLCPPTPPPPPPHKRLNFEEIYLH